jgi:hypothetical protein
MRRNLFFNAEEEASNGPSEEMPKSRLFEDSYSDVQEGRHHEVAYQAGSTKQTFVEMPYRDEKTGAEFRIRERVPEGPQGDFRVSQDEAQSRFNLLMGHSNNSRGPIQGLQRPLENPFQDERFESEPSVNQAEIDRKIRDRAFFDISREQALRPTSEPNVDDSTTFEDHGSFVTDGLGRIRDKPAGFTRGPFHVDDERAAPVPAKFTKESNVKAGAHVTREPVTKGPQRSKDPLETRINAKSKLQLVLSNVYRGVFGESIADAMMTRANITDRRPGFERPIVAHAIMDAGLVAPWSPPDANSSHSKDRIQKPESVVYAVGARAIEALDAQKQVPELLDLPKAERDDITFALGRTILNALTTVPQQSAEKGRPETQFEAQGREELKKAISMTVSPQLLQGLIKPELLSDRRVVAAVEKAVQRTTVPGGPGARTVQGPNLSGASTVQQGLKEVVHRAPETSERQQAHTVGALTNGSRQRRDLFNQEVDEKPIQEGPYRATQAVRSVNYSSNNSDSTMPHTMGAQRPSRGSNFSVRQDLFSMEERSEKPLLQF